jgi:hypothetical protein
VASSSAKTATYAIQFKSNVSDVAQGDADSLEALQKRMTSGTEAIKILQATQRTLKGSTDEVKRARADLKAQIDVEQGAITKLQLGLLKQGTSLEQLTAKSKKTTDAQKKTTDAVTAAGGPVADLRDRITSLRDMFDGAGGAAGVAKLAFLGVVAAVAAITAAAVSGAVSLAKWILEVGNAQRTASLFREAALGSAQGAKDLGDHIDALAKKVSTPKEKINDLAVSLSKLRLSGHAIVDTLAAVTQASDAMGDDVGKNLEDIITRSQMSGRVGLSPQELLGTNLDFSDVAKSVAQAMGVTAKEAQMALLRGAVPIDAAAKGIRKAVEKQFAEINARKMLDVNVQAVKFKETLGGLVKDVKLEPLLKGLDELRKLFDTNTATGAALKDLVTLFGNAFTKAFVSSVPIGKAALQGLVIGLLSAVVAGRKLEKQWSAVFGDDTVIGRIEATTVVMKAAEYGVYAFAAGLAMTAATVGLVVESVTGLADMFVGVYDAAVSAGDYLAAQDWGKLGQDLISGLVKGIESQLPGLGKVVEFASESIKTQFKAALGIHSPSRVFADYGRNTVRGYAEGVEDEAPTAQRAVQAMAPSSPSSGGGGGASSPAAGRPVVVNVTIAVNGGSSSGEEIAKSVAAPSTIAALVKALEDELTSAGLVPA